MKKTISLLLALVMCLSLCACDSGTKDLKEQIEALKGTVTLESGPFIEAAEAAYAELSDSQKNEVTNYAVLVSARYQFDELFKNVKYVITAIDEIPDVDALVFSDGWSIAGVWVAYNNLTEQEKAKVSNLDKLNAAIEKINTLPGEMDESYIDFSVTVEDYYQSSRGYTECKLGLSVESTFPFLKYEDVTISVGIISIMTVLDYDENGYPLRVNLDGNGSGYSISSNIKRYSSLSKSDILTDLALVNFSVVSGTVYFNIG